MSVHGRLQRLEWVTGAHAARDGDTRPAHSFDHETFVRRFAAWAAAHPDAIEVWSAEASGMVRNVRTDEVRRAEDLDALTVTLTFDRTLDAEDDA